MDESDNRNKSQYSKNKLALILKDFISKTKVINYKNLLEIVSSFLVKEEKIKDKLSKKSYLLNKEKLKYYSNYSKYTENLVKLEKQINENYSELSNKETKQTLILQQIDDNFISCFKKSVKHASNFQKILKNYNIDFLDNNSVVILNISNKNDMILILEMIKAYINNNPQQYRNNNKDVNINSNEEVFVYPLNEIDMYIKNCFELISIINDICKLKKAINKENYDKANNYRKYKISEFNSQEIEGKLETACNNIVLFNKIKHIVNQGICNLVDTELLTANIKVLKINNINSYNVNNASKKINSNIPKNNSTIKNNVTVNQRINDIIVELIDKANDSKKKSFHNQNDLNSFINKEEEMVNKINEIKANYRNRNRSNNIMTTITSTNSIKNNNTITNINKTHNPTHLKNIRSEDFIKISNTAASIEIANNHNSQIKVRSSASVLNKDKINSNNHSTNNGNSVKISKPIINKNTVGKIFFY